MDDNFKNNKPEPLENDNNAEVKNGGENLNNGSKSGETLGEEKRETELLKSEGSITPSSAAPKTPPMKQSAETDKAKKRTAAIIITLCVLGVLVTALGIIGIVKILHSKPAKTEPSTLPVSENSDFSVRFEYPTGDFDSTTEAALESTTGNKPSTSSGGKETTARDTGSNTQATIEALPPLTKTGDNILSDNPDNEFIKIIVEKYGVDPKNLVAIYAVPDKGNNFVLEFNGKTDSNGRVIKSSDTLKRVHQIDKGRNVKTATGTITGNVGVSYAEGKLVFYLVTNVIMPQYPDYFTGVEPFDKSNGGN